MSEPITIHLTLPKLSEKSCSHIHGGTWWLSGAAARGEMSEEEMQQRLMEARTARRLKEAKKRRESQAKA